MALTEKGMVALNHIKTHFPRGAFSAKDLSDACGEKIVAATLNSVANNGYLNKLGGSPVQFEVVDEKTRPSSYRKINSYARYSEDGSLLEWQKNGNGQETTYDYKDNLDAITMSFVRERIAAGIPILVGWNDWGGHWQVIIGYDTMGTEYEGDDVIIVADPFDTTDHNQDGYGVYGAERFIYNFTFYDFSCSQCHTCVKCLLSAASIGGGDVIIDTFTGQDIAEDVTGDALHVSLLVLFPGKFFQFSILCLSRGEGLLCGLHFFGFLTDLKLKGYE